jgi:hypothetical protein
MTFSIKVSDTVTQIIELIKNRYLIKFGMMGEWVKERCTNLV